MIEAAMMSTPEVCTNNSPMIPNPPVSNKNPSTRKSLHQFTDTLDVKHNISVWKFSAVKANRKAVKKSICCVHTLQIAVVIKN